MKVKIFHYTIVKEIPLTSLNLKHFATHRRLITFRTKGTKCQHCNRVGTRLILGKDSKGTLHWDVYTIDLIPITVDHIIPRSKGGTDHIDNKQPMCSPCNSRKGNGEKHNGCKPGSFSKWPNDIRKTKHKYKTQQAAWKNHLMQSQSTT